MHVFAAFVLGYVAVKFAGSRRVETLMHADHLPPGNILFRNAFNRAFAMPVRLPMAISILLATGAYINHHPTWEVIPVIVLGGMIGLVWWWVQMSLLAILFIKRVPESITLKSLNRIRPFCAILFGFLSLIALLFL